MRVYEPERTEQLFNKKNANSTWERLHSDTSKIKTGGFK